MVPIVSKKVLIQFVNLAEDDDRYDKVLEMLSGVTSKMVEDFLGRKLELVQRVEYARSYRADATTPRGDDQLIVLSATPVDPNANLDVRYSATLQWDLSPPMVEGKDFVVDRELGEIRVFPANTSSFIGKVIEPHPIGFRVTHTSGYKKVAAKWAYLEVPSEVMTATALQVAFFFNAHTRGSIGLETSGGDSSSSKKDQLSADLDKVKLLPEVRAMLAPFAKSTVVGYRK